MQVFSNNAATTLAAELSAVATSMTVTASTGFAAITAPQFELVTLEVASSTREIVKVAARSGDTWTIERAQEGTTAVLWAAGSKVEARPTAGTLAGMMQSSSYPDLSGLDQDGNARGTNAVNLQSARSAVDRVASGEKALAVGYNASASATESTAVGNSATASAEGATAVGRTVTASGLKSVAAGYIANATGAQSVAVGSAVDATAESSIAIGDGPTASGLTSIAIGLDASATGNRSLAIGQESSSTGSYDSIALGSGATSGGQSSIAIGNSALAPAGGSISIGSASKALGYFSTAISSIYAFAGSSIASYGFWAIPVDDWSDQFESGTAGTQSVFATPNVDLGVPPVWQSETVYAHGQVVRPTTGGTVQFRVWCDWDDSTLLHSTPTSTTSEPTWPAAGGSVDLDDAGDASWIGIDLGAGYETAAFPDWLEFWPSEIAFICQEYTATTGTPTVSIGTPSAPTLILNAATVGITAAGQIFRFTLPNPCPRIPEGESILITLDGAASAGQMAGRFLFTGAFVATRSRT